MVDCECGGKIRQQLEPDQRVVRPGHVRSRPPGDTVCFEAQFLAVVPRRSARALSSAQVARAGCYSGNRGGPFDGTREALKAYQVLQLFRVWLAGRPGPFGIPPLLQRLVQTAPGIVVAVLSA